MTRGQNVYAIAITVALVAWAILDPIRGVDFDLWYHLHFARYALAHGALPDHAFQSFLSPSPAFTDYYWLSQIVLYGVFKAGGYFGLILLRAALAITTGWLVFEFLRKSPLGRRRAGVAALLALLCFLVVFPRYVGIRPHMFSYTLIAVFLYVLEYGRKSRWVLPILGVVWANLHGVEFPVMLVLVLAYGAEAMYRRVFLRETWGRDDQILMASVAGVIASVFVTPHGMKITTVPFTSISLASQLIAELKPMSVSRLFDLTFPDLIPQRGTLLVLYQMVVVLTAVWAVRRRELRVAHVLLAAGGVVLMFKAIRFMPEAMLLGLPMVGGALWLPQWKTRLPRAIAWVLMVVLGLLPFRYVWEYTSLCGYPICQGTVPAGVTTFLHERAEPGRILNHPDIGGYLEWELGPDGYTIYSDMQTPFLFPDAITMLGQYTFREALVLQRMVSDIQPDYVIATRFEADLTEAMDKLNYAPVFFDDTAMLYARRDTHEALVEEFEIAALKPWDADQILRSAMDDPDLPADSLGVEYEAARILAVYPRIINVRLLVGNVAVSRGDGETAMRHARAVIDINPSRADGYRLRGDAYLALGDEESAARSYRRALRAREARAPSERYVYRRLAQYHFAHGRAKRAYRLMNRAYPLLLAPDISYKERYVFAVIAIEAGELEVARSLLYLAHAQVPDGDADYAARIEKLIAHIDGTSAP